VTAVGYRRGPAWVVATVGTVVLLALGAAGCSSDSGVPGPATTVDSDPAHVAAASAAATAYFQAQAANDWDAALAHSDGAAALVIHWEQGVNSITAATGTGYPVAPATGPVRVQIDALEGAPDQPWTARGFAEVPIRPGAFTAAAQNDGAGAAIALTAFVIDLAFAADGDQYRLVDYRSNDSSYPVSQLYMAAAGSEGRDGDLSGVVLIAHRTVNGTVFYLAEVANAGAEAVGFGPAEFQPRADATGSIQPVARAQIIADPLAPAGKARVLLVRPGAFPGTPGILRLTAAATATVAARTLDLPVGEFPKLTQRPIHTAPSTAPTPTTAAPSDESISSETVPASIP
jgi:hypothetical protein